MPSGAAPQLTPFRAALATALAPEEVVLWLREDRRPFALVGDWLDGLTVLGSEPTRVAGPAADPFSLVETPALARDPDPSGAGDGAGTGDGEAAVGGGWVGWLGYGLGARIEQLPAPPPAPVPQPPFAWAFYDHVVVFDGDRWWFEALWTARRAGALRTRLALWEQRLRGRPAPPARVRLSPFGLAANGAAGHVAAVAECRERIAAGEVFQANVCLRLQARWQGDPVDLFARALPAARPRFGALIDGVVSLSPERFLRRVGRSVHTEPIKGTRPRSGSDADRQAARQGLVASAKDAAEHVMIVDLMRNDLGRVCDYGSIVAGPPRVEGHAGVWHLVSTVSGQLRPGAGDGALLRATFPPGSVTGAPKVQAMKVIAELEATRRELYTGAIGIASPIAGLDLSVAIRTFETAGPRIWFGAGGGIVADSDPELELDEALAKAAGPIAAIGGELLHPALAPSRRRASARARAPAALAHGARPDPCAGVFETVSVAHGRATDLHRHLARLAASLRELYGATLDPGTEARAVGAAVGAAASARARLRVLADPTGATSVTVSTAAGAPAAPVPLIAFTLPGGLGAHKWRDRRLIDALSAHAPGTVPLLLDTDGCVLEAGYANVWIVERGALITPPADGRILPGITRAALLAGAQDAREEPLALARLELADAVFLTSSIAGRHAATLVRAAPART